MFLSTILIMIKIKLFLGLAASGLKPITTRQCTQSHAITPVEQQEDPLFAVLVSVAAVRDCANAAVPAPLPF